MARKNDFLTGEKFKEYFSGLDTCERVRIRDRFLEETGLAYPSWYTKMNNVSFSKLELRALSDICSG